MNAATYQDVVRERTLIRAWQDGDRAAGGELVRMHTGILKRWAWQFARGDAAQLDDILQCVTIGALIAATRFDLTQEVRYTTYAKHWVRAEIEDYLRDRPFIRGVRCSADTQIVSALGRGMDRCDIARLTKASPAKVERIATWIAAGPPASLDEHPWLGDQPRADDPEDLLADVEASSVFGCAVREALGKLSEREQHILRERYMVEPPRLLCELAAELGVTRQAVQQREKRALARLRELLAPLEAAWRGAA